MPVRPMRIISHTFGSRMGFIAGWTLLLTYLGFATGICRTWSAVSPAPRSRASASTSGSWWIAIGGAAMVLAWWLAYRDMRLAGRLMLGLEAVAVLGIVGLCIAILRRCIPASNRSAASFHPSASSTAGSGVGFGMVFSILSFAGFEGAATLGEETHQSAAQYSPSLSWSPSRLGHFFIFVAYCEVVGFGPNGIKALGQLPGAAQ